MPKRRRVIVWTVALSFVGVVVALFAAYQATRQVPTFYREAIVRDQATERQAADEFGTRATTLYNDTQTSGEWHALFSADQINSWLAVDLPEKHPGLLPDDIEQPRVAIAPGRLTLGFRTIHDGQSIIVSIDVGIYVVETDVVACRFYRARAGLLRLPLKQVLDEVVRVAARNDVPIRWEQVDGDPVALLSIMQQREADAPVLQFDKIELLDGELYIAGRTTASSDTASSDTASAVDLSGFAINRTPDEKPDEVAGTDGQPSSKVSVQR
jgi:hypothetical protein